MGGSPKKPHTIIDLHPQEPQIAELLRNKIMMFEMVKKKDGIRKRSSNGEPEKISNAFI